MAFSTFNVACIEWPREATAQKVVTYEKYAFHYANTPMQYTAIFHSDKNVNFQKKFFFFSYFCSKHRLWVHIRTASFEAVLMSTHNVCFRAKIRKKCIPL